VFFGEILVKMVLRLEMAGVGICLLIPMLLAFCEAVLLLLKRVFVG